MKARIARSNVQSVQKEMEQVAMQEVLAIYRMCIAIALNQKYHFGNGRLKEVFDETDDVLKRFDGYAGDISKAKGYSDLDTGREMLVQALESRGIDIEHVAGIKIVKL